MNDITSAKQESRRPALELIAPTIKTGQECVELNGKAIDGLNLLKFWQWSSSNLLSNTMRGILAEFIVATALDVDLSVVREDWAAYDLLTPEGIKVEVKSAAYIQTWYQEKLSSINFDIKAKKKWDAASNFWNKEPARHADVYVFCLFKEVEAKKINPLEMDQWDFFVLPVDTIKQNVQSSHKMALSTLRKLSNTFSFEELREVVMECGMP